MDWYNTLIVPSVQKILGPDLGTISLYTLIGHNKVVFYILDILAGLIFVAIAFGLNVIEKTRDFRWLYSGIALALLNFVVFSRSCIQQTYWGLDFLSLCS